MYQNNFQKNFFRLFLAFIIQTTVLFAQENPLYNDREIPEVKIFINPDSLAAILAPGNEFSDHEYPARFIFQSITVQDTIDSIGFRLRGNTSRVSLKKSFKVSFNTFIRGRKYFGMEKLNLNGEHNDPSIIRAKLCWDLFNFLNVPSSRANHIRLFINGEYFGLYINVEHIDENFVNDRFGSDNGNLYKCLWPADLAYLGDDPNLYKLMSGNRRVYELKTNEELDDYSDLAEFISVLNLTPDNQFEVEIQQHFNVDGFLRILAVDVAVGSWDDYWYLKNNYYLYNNPVTGKFEFIPYDYDNTFGIDWVGPDWGNRDIYNWGHDWEVRPLAERILAVPDFKNRLSYYLNTFLNYAMDPNTLFARIDSIKTLIEPAALADNYRILDYGFSISDFYNSYNMPVSGSSDAWHVEYGLKPYITTRRNSAFSQLVLNNIKPIILNAGHAPRRPQANQDIRLSAYIEDDQEIINASVNYRDETSWKTLVLRDDGTNGDVSAGDKNYTAILPALNRNVTLLYYISATDNTGALSRFPAGAPTYYLTITVGYETPLLFINEFLARNDTGVLDNAGEREDWIEIYNGAVESISLSGLYLTDNLAVPDKWAFPDTVLQSGGFLLIWADEDQEQGSTHANFKLDKDGEELGIFNHDSTNFAPIDTFTFGIQSIDVSYGRVYDGSPDWNFFISPTPGTSNSPNSLLQLNQKYLPEGFILKSCYPNPFNPSTTIRLELYEPGRIQIDIYAVTGSLIRKMTDAYLKPGSWQMDWNGTNESDQTVSSGLYFIRAQMITNSGKTIHALPQKVLFIK